MRHALSLIELIFAILIIAITFVVVPKIIFASNKAVQLSIKQDGIYDALALMGLIVRLPWDQKTIDNQGEILEAGGVDCNGSTHGYRIGGFIGSRNCLYNPGVSPDDTVNGCDDIDDFNDEACYSDASGGRIDYNLSVSVTRDKDDKNLSVEVASDDPKLGQSYRSTFFYDSYNLGQIRINRRYVP